MVEITDEQMRAHEERRRKEEEAELSLVRDLVDFAGMWKSCENRACRRAQGCNDPRACRKKHADGILWWKRNVRVPYLRKRYPTVQWGAPAGVVEPQYQAALEAEREEEARRQGRTPTSKKSRVVRQALHDPGDV